MKLFTRILVALMLLSAPLEAGAAQSLWEAHGPLTARDVERVDDSGVELIVHDRAVILTLTRPMPVKVLTILGQPVGQETLPAGVHRLKLTTRGIYIVRVGQITRRVTV